MKETRRKFSMDLYWLLYTFVLFWTAISIATVDEGKNGATLFYVVHCAIAFGASTAIWIWSKKRSPLMSSPLAKTGSSGDKKLVFALFAQVCMLLVLLFAFDGLQVLRGTIYRGAYRTQFGSLGFLLAAISKYCVPALFAYGCFVYRTVTRRTFSSHFLLAALFVVSMIAGMTLGAKTSALQIVSGGFIFFFWDRLSVKKVAAMGLTCAVLLVFGAIQFDRVEGGILRAASYVGRRLTSVQGLPALTVWDLASTGQPLPEYAPTLLSAVGSPGIALLTGARRPSVEYMRYDYSMGLTALVFKPADDVLKGEYNVTGTVFAEGVIAFGRGFFWIFSLFAGVVIGANYVLLRWAIAKGNAVEAALIVTYFTTVALSWVNSGGVTLLFHIVTVIGMTLAGLVLLAVDQLARATRAVPSSPTASLS